ncbi:MAG: hemerythrin domain-containing protein [Thermoprotei archaeon]|jgi:hemerythrin-like domain-containing protein
MVRPRSYELEDLINILLKEHKMIMNDITELKNAINERNHEKINEIFTRFDSYLNQHVIDEESRLLKILLDNYGREGSKEAIKVFQQHLKIHQLINDMKTLANTSLESLNSKEIELNEIFIIHFEKEEKEIFPWVIKTYKKSLKK